MKSATCSNRSKFASEQPGQRVIRISAASRIGLLAILVIGVLAVASFGWTSSASRSSAEPKSQSPMAGLNGIDLNKITTAGRAGKTGGLPISGGEIYSPLMTLLQGPPPPASPYTITTYAGDCTTPKSVFNVQDADKTVCAKVTGAPTFWRLIWSNADTVAVQNVAVGAGTSTFTLTSSSSLGDWRVILFEPFGGSVQNVGSFTVIDAANPSADLSISKGAISGSASAGGQILFAVQVSNNGPSTAAAVELSDSIPANTTFVSFAQLTGPVFECTSPTEGSDSGSTVCTIGNLGRGDSAVFVGTYQVSGMGGTVISNTVSGTSTTPDPNPDNNSSTASVEVVATACQLTSPENITVNADTGQAGAFVTYATPTGTGDCGQTSTGENGETIQPISCSPASGSFFSVGTSTVICAAQTGPAVSFQVTVDNPGGGLVISLQGPNPLTHECGSPFGDPGATAINGAGQSVEVTISGPSCDADGNCIGRDTTSGTYTLTYTATEGANSVSTTRTVIVSDTEAPSITVDGANPYKIQQGSCSPFVDPGVSANDGCAGAKPVTSSVSGPGGATSVNPSIAGTYTVTYTATDGTHPATATRTVLVGNFPEDEVDQPATSNQPPTITLNGDDQMSIECGTPFSDPGATATVCGGPVTVTTTGTVDIHAPGTYSITYSATANGFTTEATRTVTVESDNTAPTITLNGANPLYVECHTGTFIDPGATAHDACAGDFAATASGSVNVDVVGPYTITYNATDPSGHAAAPVTRTVIVRDTTPPSITTCPAPLSANANSSCEAAVPNFTGSAGATDICGGAVTITQSPAAGTLVGVGPTTVTITATDIWNNSSTCQTTFTVNAPQLTALGTAEVWVGLKNSDDVGTKFDLRAEVLRNGLVVGSGEVYGLSGGSSGFNNAIQDSISQAVSGSASFCPTNVLSLRLSVRVAANSGHVSGTARLWFNDSAANSRFTATINGSSNTYYLRDAFVLASTAGPGPKKTIDVLVNRNQGGNPFKPFGTWNITF